MCSYDPLTTDYSHLGWIKVAAGDEDFQKSLACGMCVEIKGQGILAELARREKILKTPIIGPIYAVVIDRCGNCKKGTQLTQPTVTPALQITRLFILFIFVLEAFSLAFV